MNILCIGDVVGKPGRQVLTDFLQKIREKFDISLVVANSENAAGGSGITKNMAEANNTKAVQRAAFESRNV